MTLEEQSLGNYCGPEMGISLTNALMELTDAHNS